MEIGRAGVDADARQQHRHLQILQIGRLAHDVGAGEVAAGLLQDLEQGRCHAEGEHRPGIGQIRIRHVRLHERPP